MGKDPIKPNGGVAAGKESPTAQQAAEAVNILVQYAALAPLPENAHVQKNIAGQILREYIAAKESVVEKPEKISN